MANKDLGEINLEKLVLEHLRGDEFAYQLAEVIAREYHDKLFDAWGDKFAEDMHERIRKMSKEFVETFAIESDVKALVKQTFNSISKQELLDILRGKNNG